MIQDIFPHKYDVSYKKPKVCFTDVILIYSHNSLLCKKEKDEVIFPLVSDVMQVFPQAMEKAKFLFSMDSINYFELRNTEFEAFGNWEYMPKEEFRTIKPLRHAFAAITGLQIHNFYTNNTFCGKCGGQMKGSSTERAMICTECKRTVYPQICPGVIVAITNGNKLLLTRYAARHSKHNRFALVAGYNEVGESLEDTVRREAMEEVGLRVKNIRYFKSQPWAFSDTLLVGFFCEVDGQSDVILDENELSEAVWLTRDEIPDDSADPTISLTGTMIYEFKHNF